jgi:hypothetical protein
VVTDFLRGLDNNDNDANYANNPLLGLARAKPSLHRSLLIASKP